MRNLFKIIAILIGVLLGLASLLLGVLNLLPDEELLPGAQAWLEREPPDFPAEQNADYYLWGLTAPVDYPVFEFGRARIERFAGLYQGDKTPRWEEIGVRVLLPDGVEQEDVLMVPPYGALCDTVHELCLETFREEGDALLDEDDNALLLERYRRLLTVPHYHTVEGIRADERVDRYGAFMMGQQLHHAQIVQRFFADDTAEALAALAADLRFSRMLYAEADGLRPKMLTNAMIARDLRLYSELLDSNVAIDRLVKAVRAIEPLSAVEYDMTEVMRGEFLFVINFYRDGGIEHGVRSDAAWWQLAIYTALPARPNAFANLLYRDQSLWAELAPLTPEQIDARYREILDSGAWQPTWQDVLYHRDVLLFSEPHDDYPVYLYRLHDLDGLIRMVQLKAEIRSKRISAGEVQGYLEGHANASVYGQPIRWCPSRQILYYQPLPKEGQHMEWLYELPLQLLSVDDGSVGAAI